MKCYDLDIQRAGNKACAEKRKERHAQYSETDMNTLWVTTKELADQAGITASRICHYIKAGVLPAIQGTTYSKQGKVKSCYLIHPNDATAFLATRNNH